MCLWGCGATTPRTPVPLELAALPDGCSTPGEIINTELPEPARGYSYSYSVYLPPCFSAEDNTYYPVLYLVPGRRGSPNSWLAAGLPGEVDRLILAGEISPLLIVVTENTDTDPMAETIFSELLPVVESQYPIADDRRFRAAAGGSLGGIAAYRLAFQHPETFSSAGIFGAGAISGEEPQIRAWLSRMDAANRPRVFMNTGEQDPLMLGRARVMQSILDEAVVENQLYVDDGGHHYSYWLPNFERYLKWLAEGW